MKGKLTIGNRVCRRVLFLISVVDIKVRSRLHAYEADFLQGFLKNKDRKLTQTFNSSFRYIQYLPITRYWYLYSPFVFEKQRLINYFILDFSNVCRMVVYKVEKSNVLMLLQSYFQNGSKLLGRWFKFESENSEGQWTQKENLYSKTLRLQKPCPLTAVKRISRNIMIPAFLEVAQRLINYVILDFSNVCRMVVYKVEKSNVLMLLQTYWDLELKVSSKSFEFFNIHNRLTPLLEKQVSWYFWRSVWQLWVDMAQLSNGSPEISWYLLF
jgi:hypothetical protein